MNNSALKLFHELMKKGWIDRNDNIGEGIKDAAEGKKNKGHKF